MEVSKGDFLLVWIFSIARNIVFFPRYCLFLEISNAIDMVFFFVHNKMAHLKVSRKSESLVLKHGYVCLFHKILKRQVCIWRIIWRGTFFSSDDAMLVAQDKSGQFFEYCFIRTYL